MLKLKRILPIETFGSHLGHLLKQSFSQLKRLGRSIPAKSLSSMRRSGPNPDEEYSRYQKSVSKLNQLQMIPSGKTNGAQELIKLRLKYTSSMCRKLNITDEDINNLNIIHVTGTKGKGSTAAFIESTLRNHGYKTGLFTSPHLIEVKERIKIGGVALSYSKFQQYFDYCFEKLFESWTESDTFERPSYFQFLTCMMFYTFCKESVQVAVIEVGIGGEFDNTNIIQKPVACCVTSLGLDHCSILGNTVEEIAWQKSGIFKDSAVAFVHKENSPSIMQAFTKRAKERDSYLCLVPTVDKYFDSNQNELNIALNGSIQYVNSSLALQICKYWIESRNTDDFDAKRWIESNSQELSATDGTPILKPILVLNQTTKSALTNCKWPGRNQIIESRDKRITYYLDGAHTNESIEQFISWFLTIKKTDPLFKDQRNVLLFNYTGERDPHKFLEILMDVEFDTVAFSKLEAFPQSFSKEEDNVRKMPSVALDTDLKYQKLLNLYNEMKEAEAESRSKRKPESKSKIFDNVLEALDWLTESQDVVLAQQLQNSRSLYSDPDFAKQVESRISDLSNKSNCSLHTNTNVLITGSLYLVGLALKVLNYRVD